MDESLYNTCIEIVKEHRFASASFILRRLKIEKQINITFKEAIEIINRMEKERLIGEINIMKPETPRKIFI